MRTLKRLNPQMHKLVAQLIHQKHQVLMAQETAELRAVVLELLNRGYDPKRVFDGLLTGDSARILSDPVKADAPERQAGAGG